MPGYGNSWCVADHTKEGITRSFNGRTVNGRYTLNDGLTTTDLIVLERKTTVNMLLVPSQYFELRE